MAGFASARQDKDGGATRRARSRQEGTHRRASGRPQRVSRFAWARLPRAETWPRTRVVFPVAAIRCCFTVPAAFFAFEAIFRPEDEDLRTAFFGRGGIRN
jgi:hypothetical protein